MWVGFLAMAGGPPPSPPPLPFLRPRGAPPHLPHHPPNTALAAARRGALPGLCCRPRDPAEPASAALREHMGLTQREMADELEVRQQTISEWETGLHRPHRSTQKTLSMVAERAGFQYEDSIKSKEPASE